MANAQTQAAPTPTIPMATTEDLSLPPPPVLEDLPPPPPKESFSKFHQQRQAGELRRLYRHIHPELRKNLAEAVAEDLAEVLGSEEPTEGDVQCMRWIFENWRLDAIGDHEKPAAKEPVPGGDVQATSRKFEEGSFANSTEREPAGPRPSGGDVRAARWLFETKPLDELGGQEETTEPTVREPAASGDVKGTKMLFETRPLDRLGSRPSIQEQSPLELRSEIQELKGDVKKTVKLFQTEPLCAIQDAEGAIHEVKAACREEIQSNAVRSARWLFETRPLDAFNQDPSQVRVIRGISLEEGARPDVSATRWIFETQPLDAIREILVDEKDFQPSPDLIPPGPDVQQQRHLFETRALDTLKGEEEAGAEAPPKEEVVPGDVRSTLWLFETKPLDTLRDKVQVGHLQRVGHQEGEGLMCEHLPNDGSSALSLSQGVPQRDGVKGDVKTFKNLFETLPLDSIGQGEPLVPDSANGSETTDSARQSQGVGSPVYAMQDSKGHLHALTSVSREQVVGGDVKGYRWMFETQPLDQLGRSPSTIDVVRGITRQEVVAGDVGTARWLFETQPLEMIHQREQQERLEEERKNQEGPKSETPPKGDVQTIRWLFETCPMSELAEKQGSEVTDPTTKAEARSCTWMFKPPPLDQAEGSREQHLQVSQVQAGERQTDGHVFETEPLQASAGRPCGRGPVRYCSRVEIPSGQVSRQKEVFQALESGKREDQGVKITPGPIAEGSVHKFTWLFENCPMGSLAAESIQGGNLQEEQPGRPSENGMLEKQETAAELTLRTLHATPGILHHGGILMETRGPGDLYLAKYMLPSPGQGHPHIRKEELVSGELPRIVRQVLRRPDIDQQGLLVQQDPTGQLRLQPLRLPAPGNGGNIEDLDPELQQLLACSLGASVTRTGLVMQETEQGLVSLTAYSLQPQLPSRAPERRSVQLLASCIDKGDLSGLHDLRWEPPADPSPVPASEGAQKLPPTDNIIRVPPLDPSMGVGHPRGLPQAIGKAIPLAGETATPTPLQDAKKQEDSHHTGQKEMAAMGKSGGAMATPPGPGTPDLQAAMQSLRMETAKAQSLHQQVLNKHKQASAPAATSAPVQDGLLKAPATATGATQSNSRPVARGDSRNPATPRKVSGEEKALPRGLPEGWVTIQDGVYTAHPVRTFEPPRGVQPSEKEPQPRDRQTVLSAQAPSPLQEGPGQSPGPGQKEPGSHTQRTWESPGNLQFCSGGLQAAKTTLKTAPLTHNTLPSGVHAAGANRHSHNASVPPPPTLPAAVTGPDFSAQARHDEDSTQQTSKPLQDSLHIHSSPAGQKTSGGSQTKAPKLEPAITPRKKPPVPPKPAHLAQTHPPQRLPKPSALSPNFSLQTGQQKYKPGETEAAIPQQAKIPTASGQGCMPLVVCSSGQSHPDPQHSLSTVASRPTKDHAAGSNVQSPEPHKFNALNNDCTSPQQDSSPPREQPMECSKQGAPENPQILQGSQQELQGLLSQVQALEKEAASSVDVRALKRLFETMPQLGEAASQVPDAPCKPEVSVEQAFGELTRVSTEVARLKEQTLARLLDIEEAVHKALSSMSSLQPEVNTRNHSQGPHKDPSTQKVSVLASSRARPSDLDQEVKDPIEVKSQAKVECHTEDQGQANITNHTEARGQVASAASPTRRLEALREDSGLPRVLPFSRDSPSSPTFISIQSATRKLPEASSPKGSHDVSGESIHLAQDIGQTQLHQESAQDLARKKEVVTQCSEQPKPTPTSERPLPTERQKSVLELQTVPGGSQCYGATRTVTEQYEEVDQFGNTVLASSTVVTEQAEPLSCPHLGVHASPLLRQFLHSPAGFNSGLEEAEMAWMPYGHS
ncbi:xin actin-binding repeat-containing protein 1 isoform X1 [Marmota marmota marmota]|uniref:xin actin-binding repeat-containing protein 1 isoform X1 n=1 Tax=Marmota marmota marmota TaxID=9994 RepID=UPI00209332F3|nr:xin actin-binding repeat-containing protein 1 isoform X1 [Marmota marmota marmota]XP_048650758.1 xin actin-binding repeat-containing protein 1 isoform X1 [Marmota marmota marmota]